MGSNQDERLDTNLIFDPAQADVSFGKGRSRDNKKAKQSPPKASVGNASTPRKTSSSANHTNPVKPRSGTNHSTLPRSTGGNPPGMNQKASSGALGTVSGPKLQDLWDSVTVFLRRFGLPIALAMVLIFLIRGCNAPQRKIESSLEDGKYSEAVTLYMKKIQGNERKETRILELFEDSAFEIKGQYAAQKLSAQEARAQLAALEKIGEPDLNSTIAQILNVLSASEAAEELYLSGSYAKAMNAYLQIDPSDGMDKRIETFITGCIDGLVNKAENNKNPKKVETELLEAAQLLQDDDSHKEDYDRLQTAYCQLMARVVEDKIKKSDFSDDIYVRLCQGIERFPGANELEQLKQEYQKHLEKDIEQKVKEKLSKFQFREAEELVDSVLQSDPENAFFLDLNAQINREKSVYEVGIREHVEKLTAELKYDEALSYLKKRQNESKNNPFLNELYKQTEEAYHGLIREKYQELLNNGQFAAALDQVYAELVKYPGDAVLIGYVKEICAGRQNQNSEEAVLNIDGAKFVSASGTAVEDGAAKTFPISYTVAGTYSIRSRDMVNGLRIFVQVFDDKEKAVFSGRFSNDEESVFQLTENGSYKLVVTPDRGEGEYFLLIGKPKETVNITEYTVVNDSIEYDEQKNIYLFTPDETGRYRFIVSNMVNGFAVQITVKDHLNYDVAPVAEDSELTIDQGLTFELTAGQTYRIQVAQKKSTGSYELHIWRQQETLPLFTAVQLNDSISYKHQQNHYTFTAPKTKTYQLQVSGLKSGLKVELCTRDNQGYTIGEDKYLKESGTVDLELEAGKTYSITLCYSEDFGNYTISIK